MKMQEERTPTRHLRRRWGLRLRKLLRRLILRLVESIEGFRPDEVAIRPPGRGGEESLVVRTIQRGQGDGLWNFHVLGVELLLSGWMLLKKTLRWPRYVVEISLLLPVLHVGKNGGRREWRKFQPDLPCPVSSHCGTSRRVRMWLPVFRNRKVFHGLLESYQQLVRRRRKALGEVEYIIWSGRRRIHNDCGLAHMKGSDGRRTFGRSGRLDYVCFPEWHLTYRFYSESRHQGVVSAHSVRGLDKHYRRVRGITLATLLYPAGWCWSNSWGGGSWKWGFAF